MWSCNSLRKPCFYTYLVRQMMITDSSSRLPTISAFRQSQCSYNDSDYSDYKVSSVSCTRSLLSIDGHLSKAPESGIPYTCFWKIANAEHYLRICSTWRPKSLFISCPDIRRRSGINPLCKIRQAHTNRQIH